MHKIHEEVEKIISPVYLVGGAVRDELMGVEPKDYDFSTPHTPDEIELKIRAANRRPYLVGKRFGTIGVKVEGQMVEITTFRNEKYRSGSRKPEVMFVKDIVADLGRRDFTINSASKRGKKLIDPFNGKKDIEDQIIRCTGIATSRFKEDPLRMLRACRFAAQLGFKIEERTFKSIQNLNYKILDISKERWVMELDKLLMTKDLVMGLSYMMDSGLLRYVLPEIAIQKNYDQNTPYHQFDLWTHTLLTISEIPNDINLRWAALLHDVGKPFVRTDRLDRSNYVNHDLVGHELVLKIGQYLRWSNDRIRIVSELVKNHLSDDSPLKEADKKAQNPKEEGDKICAAQDVKNVDILLNKEQ